MDNEDFNLVTEEEEEEKEITVNDEIICNELQEEEEK